MTAPAIDLSGIYDEVVNPETGAPPTESGTTGDAVVVGHIPQRSTVPRGYLLDEPDPKKACRHVEEVLWGPWRKRVKRLEAYWQYAEAAMRGVPGIQVLEDADTNAARLYVPYDESGHELAPVGMPKTPQLIQRTIATLMADPPLPECVATSADDEDRDRAELATKLLREDAGDTGGTLRADMERALELAAVYGSGFVLDEIDPQGGGWVPLEIDAHPAATTFDDADPEAVLAGPPSIDPMTGAALPAEPAEPVALVKRFVMEDGTLSASAIGARMAWRPKVVSRLLTGRHLRFIPETATGIADATGVVLCVPMTLGELAARYPDAGVDLARDVDARKALVDWRPASVKLRDVLPPGVTVEHDGKATDPDTREYSDQAIALVLCVYYRAHGQYPKGAYVCVAGGKVVLHRQEWCAVVGEGADAREECLDVPVAQFRWKTDATGADPYGIAGARELAPGDELRNTLDRALVEYLYTALHPNVFLDLSSVIQPGQLARRDGTPILTNLGAGTPTYEQVPPFPREGPAFRETVGAEMNSVSGLEETAQGVDTDSARSGIAKQQVIEQALVALSGIRNNAIDGFTRLCRIRLQLRRAFYAGEQILRAAGEDGAYQERAWTGADLRGVTDVRVARGTFTMLTRSAKQALARDELAVGQQAQDQQAYGRYRAAMSGLSDALLGAEDDKQRARVQRQLAAWRAGPPDGEVQVPPPPPMLAGAPGGNPIPGMEMGQEAESQPAAPPPPPPADPRAAQLFAPLPSDEVPWIARLRHDALADAMAGDRFARMDPAWQQPLRAEYLRMRQAAGIQTVAEQQQAAAAQQQAAAQQAAQQDDRQDAREDAKRMHEGEQRQLERDGQVARAEQQRAGQLERTQMQAAARGPGVA